MRTVSATTLAAPKNAKKAFQKGLELVKKKKLDEAQASFQQAVQTYPKYAGAWFEFGLSHTSHEAASKRSASPIHAKRSRVRRRVNHSSVADAIARRERTRKKAVVLVRSSKALVGRGTDSTPRVKGFSRLRTAKSSSGLPQLPCVAFPKRPTCALLPRLAR